MVKKYAYDHGYNKQKSRGYKCVSTTVLYRKKMKTNVIIVVMKKNTIIINITTNKRRDCTRARR